MMVILLTDSLCFPQCCTLLLRGFGIWRCYCNRAQAAGVVPLGSVWLDLKGPTCSQRMFHPAPKTNSRESARDITWKMQSDLMVQIKAMITGQRQD